jgi:sugar fermentation stimulation protein A
MLFFGAEGTLVITEPLVEGTLIARYKRFLMDLRLPDGRVVTVHCPNSGSMEGCLLEGAPVLASEARNPERRLKYTAETVRLPSGWVGINTHRTNLIVGEALRARAVPELAQYEEVRAEVPYGRNSRIDFLLTGSGLPPCYVEVKNTTWPTPDGGTGFPDAVTERGLKHLRELRRVVKEGCRAVMFYLVNREDGAFFRPAYEKDEAYSKALERAAKAGVEVIARRTLFSPPRLEVGPAVALLRRKGKTLVPLVS